MVTWKSREHLEQQALDLDVGLVGLVDEQHRRLGRAGSRSAAAGRAGTPRRRCPRCGVPVRAVCVLRRLDPQQLLLVVPLVQRPRLVEALVALQPDQFRARGLRDRALASSVLPTPAGPSTSSGLPSRSARNTVVAVGLVAAGSRSRRAARRRRRRRRTAGSCAGLFGCAGTRHVRPAGSGRRPRPPTWWRSVRAAPSARGRAVSASRCRSRPRSRTARRR